MSALIHARKLLLEIADVTSVVGTKIRIASAEQDLAPPYIVLHRVSEDDDQMLQGAGGYYETRFTVEIIATSSLVVENLGESVKKQFGDITNAEIDDGASPPSVLARNVDVWKASSDITDASQDKSPVTYRRMMDFYMRWR